MNTTEAGGGRVRACRDRCEVCRSVIEHRPVATRRRCADHLDQLVLVPAALVRNKSTSRKSRKSTNEAGEGSR
ncbi:MAG: hypothetical protein ACT4O0_06085 [Pseudonocardia sp.]